MLLLVSPALLMVVDETFGEPAWLAVAVTSGGRAALAEGGLEHRLAPVLPPPEESLPATTDPRREYSASSLFSRLLGEK